MELTGLAVRIGAGRGA